MEKEEISPAEAARTLRATLTYIYSLLWAGKLAGRKVGRVWRVSAAAVQARLASRGE